MFTESIEQASVTHHFKKFRDVRRGLVSDPSPVKAQVRTTDF